VRENGDKLFVAAASFQLADAFQPRRPGQYTGPNGIDCRATTSADSPPARRASSEQSTPANSECTRNRSPPKVRRSVRWRRGRRPADVRLHQRPMRGRGRRRRPMPHNRRRAAWEATSLSQGEHQGQ
jgi:hypothetical protein